MKHLRFATALTSSQPKADLLGCRAEAKAAELAEENQRLRLASTQVTASSTQPRYEQLSNTGLLHAALLWCTDLDSSLECPARVNGPSRAPVPES